MQVRFMDWSSDLDRVQRHSGAAEAPSSAAQQPEWLCSIPQAQDSASFDVILGSDILYEVSITLVCLLAFSAVSKRSAALVSCAAISGSCLQGLYELDAAHSCHQCAGPERELEILCCVCRSCMRTWWLLRFS